MKYFRFSGDDVAYYVLADSIARARFKLYHYIREQGDEIRLRAVAVMGLNQISSDAYREGVSNADYSSGDVHESYYDVIPRHLGPWRRSGMD